MSWEYQYEAVVATHDSKNPEFIAGTKLQATVQATVTSDKRQVNIKVSQWFSFSSSERKY